MDHAFCKPVVALRTASAAMRAGWVLRANADVNRAVDRMEEHTPIVAKVPVIQSDIESLTETQSPLKRRQRRILKVCATNMTAVWAGLVGDLLKTVVGVIKEVIEDEDIKAKLKSDLTLGLPPPVPT